MKTRVKTRVSQIDHEFSLTERTLSYGIMKFKEEQKK